MSDPHPLMTLQRWMQSVITNPRGISAGIDNAAARQWIDVASDDVEQVIGRSQKRTSIERLQVYGNAYFARLVECMREQFPALCETLGQELFDGFALDYLDKRPSTSYTLSRLADRFVPHLETTRPAAESAAPGWADFLIDLASFEWSVAQTFDAPGTEQSGVITPDDLAQVSPDDWPQTRLIAAPCLRLHAYRFPVNAYFSDFRAGRPLSIPPAAATWLALSRREYIVRRIPLDESEFLLLQSLLAGQSVGAAIEAAAEQSADFDAFARNLPHWFQRFAGEGFFTKLVKP
ncbi:HvfC/BufC N-terminal domain-containing protein [Blastopirellula marina]|uniref:Putative DNA-binding domain-containing protein n=1 Tax=Blastopirellula marina DSM 3645 TaxID=314230 RepID=A3ZMX7_9BACT|nr:DNA-binding domain-containing protein [Blastopirellula marina]EAQ82306.1 hypothetical protein DSM3645_01290 [Blastopirellula marina DSM 3645]